MRAGRLEEALQIAQRAIASAVTCLPAHGFVAAGLLKLGRSAEAESVVAAALRLQGGGADAYDSLAWASVTLGHHERGNTLYHRATQLAPDVPRFWYNLACSERSLGRLAEAQAACDRCIGLDSAQYAAYLLRSELRVQAAGANHVAELEVQLARNGRDYRATVFLGYALAKELDDLGRFDEAFKWFATAAAARRARLAYDITADEQKLARVAQVYSAAHLGARTARATAPHAADSGRYVFIVGLPRSGTTLVERILTGLQGVRSNGETDNFSRALLAAGQGGGDVFERAAAADDGEVAAHYARLSMPAGPATRIVEKLPLNYLYLGAIRRALPEARIVLVRRSPLDSCFAMYRTLFASGYPFSYDLQELARYYAAYQKLIDHWGAVLADSLHQVVYEDLVREPQRLGAAIARYCGLEWNDAAIEIQNNQSVSLTASAAQVRRPIYGSSSGRWRHYRPHLGALIEPLRVLGVPVAD